MTGRWGYNNFTQRAIRAQPDSQTNGQIKPAGSTWLSRAIQAPARPIFFDLEIREVSKNKYAQEWPRVMELLAGHKYVLVLAGSLNSTTLEKHMCPQGIPIDETIEIHIQFPPEVQLPPEVRKAVTHATLIYTLTYQEARGPERLIPFMLPASTPTKAVTFSLRYREPGRMYPGELGQRSMDVRGSYNLEDRQLLKQCHINAGLPAHAALLWIDASEPSSYSRQQKLKLRGWSYRGKLLEDSALIDPAATVSVTKLLQRAGDGTFKKDPKAIIDTLSHFSRTFSPNLIGWLQQISHKKANQEHPCLIIVDNTTLEIPWEMLELEPKRTTNTTINPEEKPYTYLGTVMQIARWLPFRCFARERRLHVKKREHTGRIISYVDPDLGDAKVHAERKALQRLGSQVYPTLDELELHMSKPLPADIGLVYIGCHGRDGNTLGNVSTNNIEAQQPSNVLRAINLEALYAAPDSQLTVFVNACEAGRVIHDSRLDRSSFVEGFLTHCASSFIGPLAPVDIQNASLIASDILAAIASDQEISIIEALRHLREQAVQLLQSVWDLPKNQKRKELYKVLDTFMYVYYGNPLAHLRLLVNSPEQEILIPSQTRAIILDTNEEEGA